MMAVVFALGMLAAGAALTSILLASRLAAKTEPATAGAVDVLAPALDRMAMMLVAAIALAIGTSWLLALAHQLTPRALVSSSVVALAVSAPYLVRRVRRSAAVHIHIAPWKVTVVAAAFLPLVGWIAYAAWRGSLLPVYNHDGLSYHFPKAVLLMKAHGFAVFDVHEARTATWPCNYELLLADTMMLTGGDAASAFIAPASYALFLLFAARLAATWWGDGMHVLVVTLVTAATPIALLHSGLHKNDLLFCSFALGAFGWAARWCVRGCATSLGFAVIATLLAIGTKASGAFIAATIAPVALLGLWGRRGVLSARNIAIVTLLMLVAGALLGAWVYVANYFVFGRLVLPPDFENTPAGYGDFANIWQFTYLMLAKPFSDDVSVYVPWRGEYWWWPSNDIWISHFGMLMTIGVVAVVPALFLFRRSGSRRERLVASLAALGAYVLTLPVHVAPLGFFNGFGRYVLFIVPIVYAWTVSPFMLALQRRGEGMRRSVIGLSVAAAIGAFLSAAGTYGINDAYAPLEYVSFQMAHEDNRVPHVRRNRAATLLDLNAGPNDVVAVDFAQDTWVYPAYGRGWTREVQYLPHTSGPVTIDPRVDWVIIDRSWNVFFGHPKFTDMGQVRYLGRGQPTAADVKVLRQLESDPAFQLVYADPKHNQALFRRIGPAAPTQP